MFVAATALMTGGVVSAVLTVTVAVSVALPDPFVAVMVYVVVVAGDTVRVPLAGTVPMPLSMVTLVALDELHDNVDDPPDVIVVGEALNVTVGFGDGLPTVTVAVSVVLPDPLV